MYLLWFTIHFDKVFHQLLAYKQVFLDSMTATKHYILIRGRITVLRFLIPRSRIWLIERNGDHLWNKVLRFPCTEPYFRATLFINFQRRYYFNHWWFLVQRILVLTVEEQFVSATFLIKFPQIHQDIGLVKDMVRVGGPQSLLHIAVIFCYPLQITVNCPSLWGFWGQPIHGVQHTALSG